MEVNNSTQTLPLEFTGKTGEFFGIWIVNVLLIIITLGFYMPWAKVRTRRYFYGNTLLDNSPFDYTANPVAILKGYLIAFTFFILYSIAINFYPLSQLVFMIVFLIIFPWLVVRSMIFRARNTVFRNIRFTFNKNYGEAIAIFAGMPLLIPITLGLILPHFIYKQKQFLVDNSGFGTKPFSFHARSGQFYKIYLILVLIFMLPFIGVIAAILIPVYQDYITNSQTNQFINAAAEDPQTIAILFGQIIGPLLSLFIYMLLFAYVESRVNNLVWNNIEIADNRFESSLRLRDLVWIYFTNLLAIIFSVGLLIPWTKIRLARYRMARLTMLAATDLNGFVKQEQEQVGAAGDEVGELFDFDIGL